MPAIGTIHLRNADFDLANPVWEDVVFVSTKDNSVRYATYDADGNETRSLIITRTEQPSGDLRIRALLTHRVFIDVGDGATSVWAEAHKPLRTEQVFTVPKGASRDARRRMVLSMADLWRAQADGTGADMKSADAAASPLITMIMEREGLR